MGWAANGSGFTAPRWQVPQVTFAADPLILAR